MTARDEHEHVRSEAGLLEVAVRGERLGQSVSVHDHEREAICQAPVLVGAAPVQSGRGITEFGLKRHDLDSPVGVNPAIAFAAIARVLASERALSHSQSTASVVTIRLAVRTTDWCQAAAWE